MEGSFLGRLPSYQGEKRSVDQTSLDRPGRRRGAAPRWPGLAFAATILLSAFLLFQVQPLISKFILPWFGGCPAVWTTCMLFFQVVLFGGYSYAHLAGSRLKLRGQAIVQLGLLAAAAALVVLLHITPAASWKPTGSAAPAGRILLLLLVTVGLPYFVLSTTSPLVQVWFSRSYPGRSPYRLYALSNFGSLAALLSYPFLFEPAFDLPRQSWLWSLAFVGYVLLCGLCAAWLWRLVGARCRPRPSRTPTARRATPRPKESSATMFRPASAGCGGRCGCCCPPAPR